MMYTHKHVFVSSLVVAVAHCASAALLGPSLGYVCASGSGCVGDFGLSLMASAALDFPLSYVRSLLTGLHDGHSYLAFAALNSIIWGAVAGLCVHILIKRRQVLA
jgi:hypothetical protein